MKMKKTAMLLTALALGVFAAHAGAETIYSGDYQSVQSAFEDLQDGDTLMLTDDCNLSEQVTIANTVTLDLNNHVLTSTFDSDIAIVVTNGNLTVKDGTASNGELILNTLADGGIVVRDGSFTLESGNIKAPNAYFVIGGLAENENEAVVINVNGGMIETDAGIAVTAYNKCEINMTGGIIKGPAAIAVNEGDNIIKISGGTVDGVLEDVFNKGDGKIEITGGTFTDNSFKAYIDESLVRDLGNGSYAVGENVTATVATENVSQQTIGDTTATGFVTTITSEDKFDLKTIKWDVTYNNATKSTSEYKLDGVTLNGDAKIGLAVDGFADANATAAATINGYIK